VSPRFGNLGLHWTYSCTYVLVPYV
jgi:hypothetical protein